MARRGGRPCSAAERATVIAGRHGGLSWERHTVRSDGRTARGASEAGTAAALPGSENRAVLYTMQMRVRRQCCIAGRSRPAY
jgi:hypothetical protein